MAGRPGMTQAQAGGFGGASGSYAGGFVIVLDKSRGERLGVDVTPADGETSFLIAGISPEGLFAKWNSNNRYRPVRPGDRIFEVNGARGNAGAMFEELKKDQVLQISVNGPQPGMSYGLPMPVNVTPEQVEATMAGRPGMTQAQAGGFGGASGSYAGEFLMVLDKSRGERLGVDMTPADGETSFLIADISPDGLFAQWNSGSDNRNRPVRPGDRIFEVNGARGNAAAMFEELKKDQILMIKVGSLHSFNGPQAGLGPVAANACEQEETSVAEHLRASNLQPGSRGVPR